MADGRDPYKVLQVDPEADPEVIQAAYRRLAQKYHPDVVPGPEAASRMVAINQAWAVLRDPEARAALDEERARDERARDAHRPRAASEPPPSPTRFARASPRSVDDDEPSGNWSSGRSSMGGGYDSATMGARDGFGAAGPAPGNPSGTVLSFGRFAGWSLGEIARTDLDYVEWLDRMPIGRPYRDEIDALLRKAGRRRAAPANTGERRGLFRRR